MQTQTVTGIKSVFCYIVSLLFVVSCGSVTSSDEIESYEECEKLDYPLLSVEDYQLISESLYNVVPLSKQAGALNFLGNARIREIKSTAEFEVADKSNGHTSYVFKACLYGPYHTLNPNSFSSKIEQSNIHLNYVAKQNTIILNQSFLGTKERGPTAIAFVLWFDSSVEDAMYFSNAVK